MIDLGKKPEKNRAVPPTASSEKYYPSLHIDGNNEIPGNVGSMITAKVKLKKVSHTIRKEKSGTTHSHSFEVHGIAPMSQSKEEAIDEGMKEGADGSDGGRPNVQSMMAGGLKAARLKNLEKARAAKKK